MHRHAIWIMRMYRCIKYVYQYDFFHCSSLSKAPQSSAPRPEEYITVRATPHTDDLPLHWGPYQLDLYWKIWDHNGPYKDLVWFHCLLKLSMQLSYPCRPCIFASTITNNNYQTNEHKIPPLLLQSNGLVPSLRFQLKRLHGPLAVTTADDHSGLTIFRLKKLLYLSKQDLYLKVKIDGEDSNR